VGKRDLAHRILARTNLRHAARAAAPGERRQRLERVARPAEMIDQRAERPRPDILAADEAEPIDPLLVGEPAPLIADFIPFSVAHFRPAAQTDALTVATLPEIENVRGYAEVLGCQKAGLPAQSRVEGRSGFGT
jgi:hypothetical protein